MTTKEKNIRIIEFSGNTEDRENWSEKFLVNERLKGFHLLLISSGQKRELTRCKLKKNMIEQLEV